MLQALLMESENAMDSGLKAALKAAGGARPLARQLGISHVSVIRWKAIPLGRILEVEQVTGVPREKLRPDFYLAPRPVKRSQLTK